MSAAAESTPTSAPRVLQVVASAGWGGLEKAFVDLSNALAERCPVAVAIPADAEYRHRLSGRIEGVHALRPGSRRNPLVIRALGRTVRAFRPDVVHTHAARATEMAYWLTRFADVRHVATKHNARRRRIFGRVRWVTAVSHGAAATIGHARGVQVVHNGITVGDRPAAEKPETFTVMGVGRLHAHKGFDRLVRAVPDLPFPCALRIAGEGPERSRLESLAESVGVGDRVTLLGHREDVPALLASAHALVVPSRTEGFGLAVVEGLHYCDVVLSTRVGVAEEVLPEELIVEPEDLAGRLVDVRARYDAYRDLTTRARNRVGDRFDLARSVERYLDVYRRVMAP